jgi:hypothetical protein
MANDRIFIVCCCGAFTMLLKHYPGGTANYNPSWGRTSNWIEEHSVCNPNIWESDLRGETGFRLVTENDSQLDYKLLNKGPQDKEED